MLLSVMNVMILIATMLIMPEQKNVNQDLIHVPKKLVVSLTDLGGLNQPKREEG